MRKRDEIGQEGLSIQQVADYLGISYSCAYHFIKETEDFPCVRIGKRRIVTPKRMLDKWLEEHTVTNKKEEQ